MQGQKCHLKKPQLLELPQSNQQPLWSNGMERREKKQELLCTPKQDYKHFKEGLKRQNGQFSYPGENVGMGCCVVKRIRNGMVIRSPQRKKRAEGCRCSQE